MEFIADAIKNIENASQHHIGGSDYLVVIEGHGFVEVEEIRGGVIARNRISQRVISDDDVIELAEYIINTFDLEVA